MRKHVAQIPGYIEVVGMTNERRRV